MEAPLPETLIPRRAALQALALSGSLPTEATPRLREAFELGGPVLVALRFTRLDDNRVELTGSVKATVRLHCQRCLEWFESALAADVSVEFGPDRPDAETDKEIVAEADAPLVLASFVEDELLLNAPMAPTHPDEACFPPEGKQQVETAGAVRRPFGELGHLLGRKEPD